MYIAFKWLVGLTLLMWFLVCGVDIFIKTLKKGDSKEAEDIYKNASVSIKSPPKKGVILNKHSRSKNQRVYGILYFTVFSAAGFFIFIISKKKIILELKKIYSIEGSAFYKYLINLKHELIIRRNTISNYLSHAWGDWRRKNNNSTTINTFKGDRLNLVVINSALLKKLKDVSEEKNSLSLLLAASIFENRYIKYNYKSVSMAKKRLEQYVEETEKKMNEALTEKTHFQHLYLISCEENMSMRARIKQLTELRNQAERNLISLVHEVCMSRNEKLMAYCSQFVVQTKNHLLRSDMRSEIRNFLRSSNAIAQLKNSQKPDKTNNMLCTKSLVSQGCNTFTSSVSDSSSAGLNGEHIWAVKNDDGFIEKLYEYDFTSDFDNGTVRRIREYSVYHDKDCVYKNSNPRTSIDNNYCGMDFTQELEKLRGCNKIQNHRLVTGSEAFKIFLKNYRNIHLATSHKIPITYK